MVEAQGGDPRVTEDPASVLPRASVIEPLLADRTGVLGAVDAAAIGLASSALGAGRVRKGEQVDPAVGIVFRPKIGDRIDTGEPLGEIHARSLDAAEAASTRTLEALTVGEAPVEPPPLIHGWFPPEGGR
jgi:thymidine phosphorylase